MVVVKESSDVVGNNSKIKEPVNEILANDSTQQENDTQERDSNKLSSKPDKDSGKGNSDSNISEATEEDDTFEDYDTKAVDIPNVNRLKTDDGTAHVSRSPAEIRDRIKLKLRAVKLFYQPANNRQDLSEFLASMRRQSLKDWDVVRSERRSQVSKRFSLLPGAEKDEVPTTLEHRTSTITKPASGKLKPVYIDMTQVNKSQFSFTSMITFLYVTIYSHTQI